MQLNRWSGQQHPISQKPRVHPLSEAAPWPGMTLTHTEDVEAEALSDRLADQLVGEAVETHMATQGEAPGLWLCILPRERRETVSPLGKRGQVAGRLNLSHTIPAPLPTLSQSSAHLTTHRECIGAPIPGQVSTEGAPGPQDP